MSTEKRNINLDILRIIAAIMVIVFHYDNALKQNNIHLSNVVQISKSFNNAFHINMGTTAVCIFFALSGILTYNTIYRTFSGAEYLKHKILKLYPAFYFAWFLACIFSLANGSFFRPSPSWMFILTLLGIDGYLSSYIGFGFYLVGEWFFGAFILITLLWPLFRKLYTKNFLITFFALYLIELGLMFCSNYIKSSFIRTYFIGNISITVSLCSFSIGLITAFCIQKLRKSYSLIISSACLLIGLFSNLSKMIGNSLLTIFQNQLFVFGLLLFIQSISLLKTNEWHLYPLFTTLSNLTLYVYFFQHILINWSIKNGAINHLNSKLSFSNSLLLELICILTSFFVAFIADKIFQELRHHTL